MKLASLPKPLRYPRVAFFAWIVVATTSSADASMSCNRAAEYYPISDPVVTRRIEERLQAIPAMKNTITRAYRLADKAPVAMKTENGRTYLNLDRPIFDPMATVVVVEFDGSRVQR